MLQLSGIAAAGMLVLTACGDTHPGAAAAVDGRTISVSEVDDVATALCSANEAAPNSEAGSSTLPSRSLRQSALSLLLRSHISLAFAEEEGVSADPTAVSNAVTQNRATIDALPEDQRELFTEAVREYAEGQLIVIAVGERILADEGQTDVDQQTALAAGDEERAKFADSLDVDIDPRFGTFADGELQPSGGSLSVPVSSEAKAGAAAQPEAGWVAGLPVSQTCG